LGPAIAFVRSYLPFSASFIGALFAAYPGGYKKLISAFFLHPVTNARLLRLFIQNHTVVQKEDPEKQFEKEIKAHEGLLWKICRLYAYTDADRQDLFQEMVIQLWKAYPTFRGEARFSTWLYRVALNTAITGLRRQKDFITSYEPEVLARHERVDTTTGGEEEQLEQLYRAISHLNEVEKALVMLYLEDRSYAEMEEVLGIGQGALRVKMTRIKEKLRQITQNA